MIIVIDNLEKENIDVSAFTSKLTFETSLDDIFSTLKFSLPYAFYEENKIKVFSRVFGSSGSDFSFSGIVINVEINNLETVSLNCVSDSFYLSTYEELIKVKNIRADETIKSTLNNYDSSFKTDILTLANPITKIYKGETIIGIIDDVLKQSEGANGRKLYRTFDNDKLTGFADPKPYMLNLEYSISDLKLSYNGEDLKTRVKVYTEEKKKISVEAIQSNPKMIQKAGVIQKVHSVKAKDKAEADLIARNLLAIYGSIKRTGSFTVYGDYKAKVGLSVTIEGNTYIISGLKHTIEENIHLMGVSIVLLEKGV